MKPNFKFDHPQENLWDALGIQESTLDGLSEKMKNIDDSFEDGDPLSVSIVAEKLMGQNLSQEELYVLAASHVRDSISEKQELLSKLMSEFGDFIKAQ